MWPRDGVWLLVDAGPPAVLPLQAQDATNARQLWVHEDSKSIDHLALTSSGNLLLMTDDRVAVLDRETGKAVWSRDDIRGCNRVRGNNLVQFRHNVRCNGGVKDVAAYTFQGNVPVTAMEIVDDDFVLTAPNAVARYDRQGQARFHRYYKAVGNSAGAKAGAVANYFLNPVAGPLPDGMDAFFAQRYTVDAKDDRHTYFLYENTDGNVEKRFGIVCVERATGKEIGTYWVNQRDPDVILDQRSKTVSYKEKGTVIRATRF
jgi:hypothetical protein